MRSEFSCVALMREKAKTWNLPSVVCPSTKWQPRMVRGTPTRTSSCQSWWSRSVSSKDPLTPIKATLQ